MKKFNTEVFQEFIDKIIGLFGFGFFDLTFPSLLFLMAMVWLSLLMVLMVVIIYRKLNINVAVSCIADLMIAFACSLTPLTMLFAAYFVARAVWKTTSWNVDNVLTIK